MSTTPVVSAVQKGPDEKFCHECGAIIRTKAEICPKCGVRQFEAAGGSFTSPNGRTKLAAGLIAIFLGSFGIHKFYLGRTGQGILYLLFFWTFIPAIIAFVEGIVYLSMTDQAFAQKYGKT
jgi:TM2 domain-containing membrane protein YozV/ribosomal protein L40E